MNNILTKYLNANIVVTKGVSLDCGLNKKVYKNEYTFITSIHC